MANGEAKRGDWPIAIFLIVLVLCVTVICVVSMFTRFWQ